MVRRLLFAVVVAAVSASAGAQGKDKVNVCHFPASGNVQLLTIARSALAAHLTHGDVEAPATVRTAADCLIPQPPTEPVAATATTGSDGRVSFVIPSTNVIARIAVTDTAGVPVGGAKVQIMVIGEDYLLIAASDRLAPAFAEGKLSDAKPGSALSIIWTLVMHAYHNGFEFGGSIELNELNGPLFFTTRFTATEHCFTQEEFQAYAARAWRTALSSGAAALIPSGLRLSGPTRWLGSVPTSDETRNAAESLGAHMFEGKTLAMRTRVYGPPLFLGLQLIPIFYEDIGPCGGSCCVALGPQCVTASSAESCSNGRYSVGVPCTASPCRKGGCCDPAGGGCLVLTAGECEALGRTYKGDDTTCTPNPCPFGACCNPSSGCTEMPQYLCSSIGGTFRGHGSKCTADPCSTGACCHKSLGCAQLTEVECTLRGGSFQGFSTSCGPPPGGTGSLTYTVLTGPGVHNAAGLRIPFTGGSIKTTVTIPPNVFDGQCVADFRVEFFVYPFNSGKYGETHYAGHQFGICHTTPVVITSRQDNPSSPCTSYVVNAVTGVQSQAVIEIIPP